MSNFSFTNPRDLDARLKKLSAHPGGEGTVYNDHQHLAIKIFNAKEVNVARKERKVRKLILQSKMVSFSEVVAPLELVTVNGHFVGYTMKFVDNAIDLDRIQEKVFTGQYGLKEALRIMIKVAQTVEKLHNVGLIIGDFHPGQILVSNGNIYFVDTDSWGWQGMDKDYSNDLKCLPAFVDPRCRNFSCRDVTLNYYSKATDCYSLAVIAFYVLTGEHPFGGVYQLDTQMSKEMRARNQLSVLGNHDIKLMKGKTWENWMSKELKKAFLDIFEGGKRFNIESALTEQLMELQYCKRHNGYYNSNMFRSCPVCSWRNTQLSNPTFNSCVGNLFLSKNEVKIPYDHETYLNKVGEVVRVNENGDPIRRIEKGFGGKETLFFRNERYMVKIHPLNLWQRAVKAGATTDSCYVKIYKDDELLEKIYVKDKNFVRIVGDTLFYVEGNSYTLKKIKIRNGKLEKSDVTTKKTAFAEFVATENSKVAIISKVQAGTKANIEIDIGGKITILPGQKPIIMKYDAISNTWIWVSQISNSKYNTIVFNGRGEKVFETHDIEYGSLNLRGCAFHRASLCIPGNGKVVFVMPYVANMPFDKVITETSIDVVRKDSKLELVSLGEKRSNLYVLNPEGNVYKFVM